MDQPNSHEDAPSAQNPPAYTEGKPYNDQPPPVDGPANPTMPIQHQPYYDAPKDAVPGQGIVVQPLLHTTVVPVQPTYVRDYLLYSILTMLFCCLPLGIAALVYSIRTRDANLMGDGSVAQRNSRMARNFAHAALGVGLALTIVSIILFSVSFTSVYSAVQSHPSRPSSASNYVVFKKS